MAGTIEMNVDLVGGGACAAGADFESFLEDSTEDNIIFKLSY